jgi:DNA mismatch repair protein MutS2
METLSPTYEMTIGLPGRSNAFAIARRLGLDETILDDAMRQVSADSHQAEDLLDSIYTLREKMEAEEAQTRRALREAEGERERCSGGWRRSRWSAAASWKRRARR